MKLSKAAVGRIAAVAGLSWAVFIGLRCAQGEDLSQAPKDAGAKPGTGGSSGFVGSGGSNGSGKGGSSGSTGTGGNFIGIGGSSNTGGSSSGGAGGAAGSSFVGAGGGSSGAAGTFIGAGGTTVTDGGGAGGSAGGGSDFDGPVSMGLQATFHSTQFSSIQFQVEVTNTGVDTPVINTLRLRYYFSDESPFGSTIVFDYAAWNGPAMPYNLPLTSTCTAMLMQASQTSQTASSYLEFGCDSAAMIGPSDKLTIQLRSTTQGEDVTNDYSWVASDGSAGVLDPHLVIYQGSTVAWGAPPP